MPFSASSSRDMLDEECEGIDPEREERNCVLRIPFLGAQGRTPGRIDDDDVETVRGR
jgi:hypothetical protein